jgi:hypothetical protein
MLEQSDNILKHFDQFNETNSCGYSRNGRSSIMRSAACVLWGDIPSNENLLIYFCLETSHFRYINL